MEAVGDLPCRRGLDIRLGVEVVRASNWRFRPMGRCAARMKPILDEGRIRSGRTLAMAVGDRGAAA